MKKPNDYDEINVGDFVPVELGGHKAIIKQVNRTESKSKIIDGVECGKKPMYVVLIDFDKNDSQPGYFMEQFKNDIRPEKKYPNNATQYILAFDKDGKTNKSLKRFITSVENSNTGFACNWTDNEEAFCKQFKDKKVGVVYGAQKDFYDGKERNKVVLRWFCDVNKASEQAIPEIQETNSYKEYANSTQAYFDHAPKDENGFMNLPDSLEEELPFN